LFYPKYTAEIPSKAVRWVSLYIKLRMIYLRIKADPYRYNYSDIAMTAVATDEADKYELFNTDSARAYVAQIKQLQDIRDGYGHEKVLVEAAE
jgi:Na+-transporting NADH:ubiquinone oxidoreductase subunit NqrF